MAVGAVYSSYDSRALLIVSLSSDEAVYLPMSVGDSITLYQFGTSVRNVCDVELSLVSGISVPGGWSWLLLDAGLRFLATIEEDVDDEDEQRCMSRFLDA